MLAGAEAGAPSGRLGALGYPEYRWFFLGSLLASVGQNMQAFAQGWLVIEIATRDGDPTRGPLYLGLVGLARFVPAVAFGLAGGVVADGFDRRRTLFAARTAFSALIAVMAALTLTDRMSLAAVMAISALSALVGAVETPTRLAISPLLTAPRHAFSAIGITRATMASSALIGPLLGGILILPLGVGWLLVVNAAMYALAGLGLDRVRALPPDARLRASTAWQSLRDGVAHVWVRPTLRGFLMANVVMAMFASSYTNLLPAVAKNALGGDAVQLSWLIGAAGFGSLAGAIALTTLASWPAPGRILLGHAFVLGAMLVALGLQHDLIPAVVVCVFLGWLSLVYYGGTGSILQMGSPNYVRGRVMALQVTIFQGGTQLGTLIIGLVGSFIGISDAMMIAGSVVLLASVVMSRIPALREATTAP